MWSVAQQIELCCLVSVVPEAAQGEQGSARATHKEFPKKLDSFGLQDPVFHGETGP